MSSINFDKTTPEVWLNQAQDNVTANLTTDEWFILNIQETGTDLNIYIMLLCVCVCVCAYAMDHF